MELVYIEWRDHFSDGDDWVELDEENGPESMAHLVCRSVGWVLAEDETTVRLIANLSDDPETAERGFGIFNIMKGAIVKRKRLRIK